MNSPTDHTCLAEAIAPDHSSAARPRSPGEPYRVLLADDDPINREIVQAMLEGGRFAIQCVADGHAAIAAALHGEFDILLLDGLMPGCCGHDVARAVRQAERARPDGSRHVPIVALTALAAESDRERCIAAGMDDYLSKPFDRVQLLEALARFLPDVRLPGALPAVGRQAAEGPVLDPEAVRRIVALDAPGDPAILRRTVALFATEAAHLANAISDSLAREDWETAAHTAHRLKSASGSLGAVRVAEACRRIEHDPRSHGADSGRAADALKHEIAAACGALDAMVHLHG
jgi:two-component system, sensor histidine kinase and response regulator